MSRNTCSAFFNAILHGKVNKCNSRRNKEKQIAIRCIYTEKQIAISVG